MSTIYRQPAQTHRIERQIVNSRFITTVALAQSTDAAREIIHAIRTEMPTANHHVYAFRVGYGNSIIEGMSDDGEPQGTSGPPTLAVLRGADIGDVVLVTTRFFGGTKLGTGGLVRAYTECAQEALATLPLVWNIPQRQIGLELPYALFELMKRLIQQHHGTITDEAFTDSVSLIVTFNEPDLAPFCADLANLSNGQITPLLF